MPSVSRAQRQCLECDTDLVMRNARDLTRKNYCSRKCNGMALGRRSPGHSKVPKFTRICDCCGGEFQPTAGPNIYCIDCVGPNREFRGRINCFGIGKMTWDLMLVLQDGHCMLCEVPPTVVDHCHKTGIVRGLLCQGCNMLMAGVDRRDWLNKAVAYREVSHS